MAPVLPGFDTEGSALLALRCGECLHQATLAAGCIILVDGAFLCSPVEHGNRLEHRFLGFLGFAGFQFDLCLLNGSPGGTTKDTIAHTAFLVLFIAFDLRFDISQCLPPEILPYYRGASFYTRDAILSRLIRGFLCRKPVSPKVARLASGSQCLPLPQSSHLRRFY
jgi:hypothetical protein